MLFSFAPMEGVTLYPYRRLHAEMFPGADRYYAPFIAPDGSGKYKASNLRDILPENNRGCTLIPQILCNRPEPFLAVARELAAMGYREVNLNLGCPSGTVVSKHKGSGLLADPAALDALLEELFSRSPVAVSVKTRMGLEGTEEFPALLEVFEKYPAAELIVHARARSGMYKSVPDLAGFAAALRKSRLPLCYNGNVFSPADLSKVLAAAPGLERVMIGRGAAADPALFRRLRGGAALEAAELREFLERLLEAYQARGLSPNHCLARMKELWYYVIWLFPGASAKALNKARTLSDYRSAVDLLFASGTFSQEASFGG